MKGYDNEKMKEYMKEYIKISEKIKCECGGKYKTYNKHIHNKTKKHKEYIIKSEYENTPIELLSIKQEINRINKIIEQFNIK